MAVDLTPILQRQNAVRQDFAAKSTANTFAKTLSQKRGSRALSDYTMNFGRQLPKFQSQWGARGLVGGGMQSGVYRNALSDYLGDYQRNLGRMQEDQFDEQQQYDFNQAGYTASRDSALADLAAQKAALIANTASQINALRPYLGGL